MRLVEPVRVEEPRPRRPELEVTDEEVVEESDEVVVVEELRSSCLLPKEPLEKQKESPGVSATPTSNPPS